MVSALHKEHLERTSRPTVFCNAGINFCDRLRWIFVTIHH